MPIRNTLGFEMNAQNHISAGPYPRKVSHEMSDREKYMGAVIDGCYRYKLWRRWDLGGPQIAWVMLNPSTADADTNDATIRRCINFSNRWGFGGMEIYNLFAYRTPYPQELRRRRDPLGDNDVWLLSIPPEMPIVAAWGAFPPVLGTRDKAVLELLGNRRIECLGLTAQGYPRHPVRLANDTEREVYWENGAFPVRGVALRGLGTREVSPAEKGL